MNDRSSHIFRGFVATLAVAGTLLALAGCGTNSSTTAQVSSSGSGSNSGGGTGTYTGNTGGASPYAAISGANTQAITVYDPTYPYGYINEPMTSVTICQPGTSTCQTIPDILVDTGSYGLRILAPLVGLALPSVSVNGTPLGECAQFVEAYDWGPVVTADIQLADQKAPAVPIQLMGSSTFSGVPASCANSGLQRTDTQASFGANGVLGIGLFDQDCGANCVAPNPVVAGFYYTCSTDTGSCTSTNVPLNQQVANPVPLFPGDNNGAIISLPSVTVNGASTLTGSLVLGIGTESNNSLGSAHEYTTNANGNFTAVYNSISYNQSFLDTGTDSYTILDGATLGLATCASNTEGDGYYCPPAATSFSVDTEGANLVSTAIGFSVSNATSLAGTNNAVFNDLAGPYFSSPEEFDFGLPFFLGRNVYVGFEHRSSPGTGMFWAY